MDQSRKDKNFQQPAVPSKKDGVKTTTTTRPEIDLPLKGGRADSDLTSKTQPKRDANIADKKSVR